MHALNYARSDSACQDPWIPLRIRSNLRKRTRARYYPCETRRRAGGCSKGRPGGLSRGLDRAFPIPIPTNNFTIVGHCPTTFRNEL